MIRTIPLLAATALSSYSTFSTGDINSQSDYQFSSADLQPKSANAIRLSNAIKEIYASIFPQQRLSLETLLDNLPSSLLEKAYDRYLTYNSNIDNLNNLWNYEFYANPQPLQALIDAANSSSTHLSDLEKTIIEALKPLLNISQVTSKAINIQNYIYSTMQNNNSNPSYWNTALNDFQNFTWVRVYYSGTTPYKYPLSEYSWSQYSFEYVAYTFYEINNLVDSLKSLDQSNMPIQVQDAAQSIKLMNSYAYDYQSDFMQLLKKYNLVSFTNPSSIQQLLGNSSIANDKDIQNVITQVTSQNPNLNLNDPSSYLKVVGLLQMLSDPSKLQGLNLDPATLSRLESQLNGFDLSQLSAEDLNSLIDNIDINNIDLNHLDLHNLNLNGIHALANSGVLRILAHATVIQKIIMGLAAAISGVLSGTMFVLSRLLFKKKASSRSKVFVVSTTVTLALISIGLIVGIFIS